MQTKFIKLGLLLLATTFATHVQAQPLFIEIQGDCTLITGNDVTVHPFDLESYAWAATRESISIPLTVDGQSLSLRISHHTSPGFHHAGRRIEPQRSFGAAILSSQDEILDSSSMDLPYTGFDGRDVGASLRWGDGNRLVCAGETRNIEDPLAACGIHEGPYGSRDDSAFEYVGGHRIDTNRPEDPSVVMFTLADASYVDCRVDPTDSYDELRCVHRRDDGSTIRRALTVGRGALDPDRTFAFVDDRVGSKSYLMRCGPY